MNAWIKRKKQPDAIINIIPDVISMDAALVYNLYIAFEGDWLGRILFDEQGYWIYDGEILTVNEQEQLARFIGHNMEVLWNS